MPPHAENPPKALSEMVNEDFYEQEICASKDESNNKTHDDFKLKIVWRNVLMFSFFHLAALYGVYLSITSAKWATVIFGKFYQLYFYYKILERNCTDFLTFQHMLCTE